MPDTRSTTMPDARSTTMPDARSTTMPDARIVRRAHEGKTSDTFSNYRDWRAFLGTVEAPTACTSAATALEAGHDWLTGRGWKADRGSETRSWLLAEFRVP